MTSEAKWMRPGKETQSESASVQETESERFFFSFKSTENYETYKIPRNGSGFALTFLTGCVSVLP